ncbi:hypothetical protein ABT235_12300 [Micromonospora echinofusca]
MIMVIPFRVLAVAIRKMSTSSMAGSDLDVAEADASVDVTTDLLA